MATLGEPLIEEHMRVRLKATAAREYVRSVRLFVTSKFGKVKASELARLEVVAFHHGLRAAPYQAKRTLGILSDMMSQAELWGLLDKGTNRRRGVRKCRETRRERLLSDEEIRRLGVALDAEEQAAPSAVHCVRLLLLTGCRQNEIVTLPWPLIDFG